jgi:hypothetical protein
MLAQTTTATNLATQHYTVGYMEMAIAVLNVILWLQIELPTLQRTLPPAPPVMARPVDAPDGVGILDR